MTTAKPVMSFMTSCPVTRESHLSNLDGSSSYSSPKSSADWVKVSTPRIIIRMKLTTPRINGHAAHPLGSAAFLRIMASDPSPLRTHTAISWEAGERIITPSKTAWPPMAGFFMETSFENKTRNRVPLFHVFVAPSHRQHGCQPGQGSGKTARDEPKLTPTSGRNAC